MIVVEGDMEGGEVALVPDLDVGDERFRRHASLLGGEHDGRAVGVVGADIGDRIALHALEAHPHVGLDVAHQMAQVQRAIGVGQGIGDKQLSGSRQGHFGRRMGDRWIIA